MSRQETGRLPAGTVGPATWAGFAVMCLGMFMAILDIQVVATSIPTIQAALSVRPEQIGWIQTAYLTAEVVAIPLTGLLTRLLTMRWLFVWAVALFTLASVGCAASQSFGPLLFWRVVQGLAGGTLIPAVFSAVFLLFPERRQGLATTLAGVLAVLAPTVGPIVGGWITATWSWHWLFLINVLPGLVAAASAIWLLPREQARPELLRRLDLVGLAGLALALAALEIGLKQAPDRGWLAAPVLGLFALSALSMAGFVLRSLRGAHPVVELGTLGERSFAVGCLLSFVLGIGLFGSVYLMPVFLGFVRGHDALEIGRIMLVTGIAQLATAPLAVALERRIDPRLLTGAGFALLALGLGLSAFQTAETDFDEMLWPQVIRGVALMFCLLPPTRIALGGLAPERVPDASGLFNLMRNLGGALGLAAIDTVIYGRAPEHAARIAERLAQGDLETARALGLPPGQVQALAGGPVPPAIGAMVQPMIEQLALVRSINEAWALIALLTALALLSVPFARPRRDAGD